MKPGLSLRRGKGGLTDAQRLAAVSTWTQEPAIEAAKRADVPMLNPEQPIEAPAVPAAPVKEAVPWEGVNGSRMSTYRLPERVYLKLKWLGETTYGTNATKILCDILEPELNRMLKERGIEP